MLRDCLADVTRACRRKYVVTCRRKALESFEPATGAEFLAELLQRLSPPGSTTSVRTTDLVVGGLLKIPAATVRQTYTGSSVMVRSRFPEEIGADDQNQSPHSV